MAGLPPKNSSYLYHIHHGGKIQLVFAILKKIVTVQSHAAVPWEYRASSLAKGIPTELPCGEAAQTAARSPKGECQRSWNGCGLWL